jgi:hypothetical protein
VPRGQTNAEAELTDRTMDILRRLRQQFGPSRTAYQTIVDQYMRLVAVAFAYNDRGMRDLPFHALSPYVFYDNWISAIKLDLSHLLVAYWLAVREGNTIHWNALMDTWEERLRNGIDAYVLAPNDNHFILLTREDAKAKKEGDAAMREQGMIDRLDLLDARQALRRHEESGDKTISLDDLKRDLPSDS